MPFPQEEREALHLLHSVENGSSTTTQIGHLIDEADPALVYLVFTWLREKYGGGHPAAEGVLGRILDVTRTHKAARDKMAEGKQDPIATWFEEEHEYRALSAEDFIALVVEKLES